MHITPNYFIYRQYLTETRNIILEAWNCLALFRFWNLSQDHLNRKKLSATSSSVTKNAVFWNVTSCGCCKNRRFGGT
jgi:hypothetical protein